MKRFGGWDAVARTYTPIKGIKKVKDYVDHSHAVDSIVATQAAGVLTDLSEAFETPGDLEGCDELWANERRLYAFGADESGVCTYPL